MTDCIFCKIAAGEIPAKIVHETDAYIAFHDLNPVAPTHILLIPRKHIPSLAKLEPEDTELIANMMLAARRIAADEELHNGFRVVANNGPDAGQSVHHLHFHILGGRSLGWPPG